MPVAPAAPMPVNKLRDDLYEVGASNGVDTYFVRHGIEGPFWSCTCTGWATSRNRAGGKGHKGRCRHVTEIERRVGDEAKTMRMAAELLVMRRELADL